VIETTAGRPTDFAVVGRSTARPYGLNKTTGQARYADDLKLPGMAFCRLLRSTRPHARILAIDTSAARSLPGVYGVTTAADLPSVKHGVLPVGQDEEVLCAEKVRFVGDAVAAVAAVDEETVGRALELIDETPITPDKVLRALELEATGKEPRIGPTSVPSYAFPRVICAEPPQGAPLPPERLVPVPTEGTQREVTPFDPQRERALQP
jgi:xanthine dehydrogenase molybdopterin-binding subunit B